MYGWVNTCLQSNETEIIWNDSLSSFSDQGKTTIFMMEKQWCFFIDQYIYVIENTDLLRIHYLDGYQRHLKVFFDMKGEYIEYIYATTSDIYENLAYVGHKLVELPLFKGFSRSVGLALE